MLCDGPHNVGMTLPFENAVPSGQVHRFTDLGYRHLPFANQSPQGLPHPSRTVFDFEDERLAAGLNVTNSTNRTNGVIYVLVNGGDQKMVEKLKHMMASFDIFFNHRFQYPVVVFAENVTSAQEAEVRSSQNTSYRLIFHHVTLLAPSFVNLSSPIQVPPTTVCGKSTLGYRHMCRFHALRAHELLSSPELGGPYDWHWRLDDDSEFTAVLDYDPFLFLQQQKKRYGFIKTIPDAPACVEGLWEEAKKFIHSNSSDAAIMKNSFFNQWPEGHKVVNNFEISHSSVFAGSHLYRNWFTDVDRAGGIYMHRWCDGVIKTIGLALSVRSNEVHQFDDIGFTHLPFIRQSGRRHTFRSANTSRRLMEIPPFRMAAGFKAVATEASDLQQAMFGAHHLSHSGFHSGPAHWTGGDVGSSLVFNVSHSLWIFGDSLIGHVISGKRISTALKHGSVALVDRITLKSQFFTDVPLLSSSPSGNTSDTFYWATCGMMLGSAQSSNRTLILLAQHVTRGSQFQGMFSFRILGSAVLTIRNPDDLPSSWQVQPFHLNEQGPGNKRSLGTLQRNWYAGIAIASSGAAGAAEWLSDDLLIAGTAGWAGLRQTIGRLSVADILAGRFSSVRLIWEGNGLHGHNDSGIDASATLKATHIVGQSELSLHFHPALRFWYSLSVVQTDGMSLLHRHDASGESHGSNGGKGRFGSLNMENRSQVIMHTAKQPSGPWSSWPVFDIPHRWQGHEYYTYAAKAHPDLCISDPGNEDDNEIIFTYVVNGRKVGIEAALWDAQELSDPDVYVPQFVRIRFYSGHASPSMLLVDDYHVDVNHSSRPNCADCRHLPPNRSVWGDYAGTSCSCLVQSPLPAASLLNANDGEVDESTAVLAPPGPLDVCLGPGCGDMEKNPRQRIVAGRYLQLVKNTVLNYVYRLGSDAELSDTAGAARAALIDGRDAPPFEMALTMVGRRRLDNLHDLLLQVVAQNVPGDIIETGVWRGGCSIFATALLQTYDQLIVPQHIQSHALSKREKHRKHPHTWKRRVIFADSFVGIPAVQPELYPADIVHEGAEKLALGESNSIQGLRASLLRLGLPHSEPSVVFLRGYFNETLPAAIKSGKLTQPSAGHYSGGGLSLIRLDGDTYESTITALQTLYPLLNVGGFVIVDDWFDWEGARQAIIDYRYHAGIDCEAANVHRSGKSSGLACTSHPGEHIVTVYHNLLRKERPRGVWWQKQLHRDLNVQL